MFHRRLRSFKELLVWLCLTRATTTPACFGDEHNAAAFAVQRRPCFTCLKAGLRMCPLFCYFCKSLAISCLSTACLKIFSSTRACIDSCKDGGQCKPLQQAAPMQCENFSTPPQPLALRPVARPKASTATASHTVIDKEDQKAEVEPHNKCNAAEDVADAVEVPLSELLAQHACLANLMEEKNSELLAISEERAAQAFQAAFYEEEAARLREWTYAYQAAAKAEALTAQRCRSEMVTAAPVPSLEPIVEFVECESSSTQSSPEEGGPGHADICPGLFASPVDQTDQEMKALISRLQDELLEAEADRATTLLQRDEAQEALMSLQQDLDVPQCKC
eukprot:symbB.v1.2.021587.t1/scaffold1832.1/size99513/3